MNHTCLYLPTKTQISGREYRACPVCGNTPPIAIILTVPDRTDTHRPAPVCADESRASVRQGTVCGNPMSTTTPTTTPCHMTPEASQGNAFTRPYNGEPSVFGTRTKAGPGVNAFAVKPPSDKQLAGKVQISYAVRGKK